MIRVKNADVLDKLLMVPLHLNLRHLLKWLVARFDDVTITSAHRPGDDGVHGQTPCRGLDIRSWIYDQPSQVVAEINRVWMYDPQRPELSCALLHDVGKGAHIHLQVHDRTAYKGG